MIEVRLNEGDTLDRALKVLKRKLQKAGLFSELRRRRYYLKPSATRQLKEATARRRGRKKQRIEHT